MYHCVDAGIGNQDQLFRYGLIDLGYDNGHICYQLVVYNTSQSYPKQYLIDKDTLEIKEWKR